MKAISLRQPWATLVADGVKSIETRTWPTNYRGPLLIVSSRVRKPLGVPPMASDDALAKVAGDPLGNALAIVELVDCRPMVAEDATNACCELYPRAWAWILTKARRITPFPVKGQLGLYEVQVDV